MKRFKYSLENVLHYKEQILDSIKAEHGTLLAQIRKKEAEIQELENKLVSAQNKMDDLKKQDVQIKDICLYGMYISEMENQIRKKQEQLKLLQQQEEKKKVQVIAAKIDTSRCEFPYKSRVMGTSEPLKPLKAPYMARNPVKWGFFRLKGQEIPLKI